MSCAVRVTVTAYVSTVVVSCAVTLTLTTVSPTDRSTCCPSAVVSASASGSSPPSRYAMVALSLFLVAVTVTRVTV